MQGAFAGWMIFLAIVCLGSDIKRAAEVQAEATVKAASAKCK